MFFMYSYYAMLSHVGLHRIIQTQTHRDENLYGSKFQIKNHLKRFNNHTSENALHCNR